MASNSFQRSPSKVWWAQGLDEGSHSDWSSRTRNGSPSSHKSQDSGFSDSEISPPLGANAQAMRQKNGQENAETTPNRLFINKRVSVAKDILKNKTANDNSTPKKNLTENLKEKFSSKKSILNYLTDEKAKNDQRIYERYNPCCRSLPSTPKNKTRTFNFISKSASQAASPNHSPRLFHSKRLTLFNSGKLEDQIFDSTNNVEVVTVNPPLITIESSVESGLGLNSKVNRNLMNYFPKTDLNDNFSKTSIESSITEETNLHSVTLPPLVAQPNIQQQLNLTVPLYYKYHLDRIEYDYDYTNNNNSSSDSNPTSDSDISALDTSNEILSCSESFSYQNENGHENEEDNDISDCEREIESFFPEHLDKLDPLPHTSTPKANFKKCLSPLRKRIAKQRKSNNALFATIDKIPETNPLLLPQFPPVKCWLNEVEQLYEPECMTTLQCKSIANDLARQVAEMAENLTHPIRNMLAHSRIIIKEFNKIKIQLQSHKLEHLGPLSQSLVGNITEYVLKNMVNSQPNTLVDSKQTKNDIHDLLEISTNLRKTTMVSKPDVEEMYSLLIKLEDMFYMTEYNILSLQIQLLINNIEEPSSYISLRAVLSGITSLASQYERLGDLVVRAGGPRALLILCVECKASTIRTMALRTLATICCSTTVIRQMEQADGVEVLAEILSDSGRPEPELSEATAVLAQITAPWIEDNHNVKGLSENAGTLITAITNFLEKTKCCQNLLLCAAALANITYMNAHTISFLIENTTVAKLLNAVRNRGPRASIFLKEQTAILIANLSDIPEARDYLSDNNTGIALLCFLQIYPVNTKDEAQTNAAQRLQQKSAIALSRLCSEKIVAQQIVELGGVTRLVQLCKEGKERNNSDAVLVACLATLRKIVANCGTEIMDQKDVMELVEPRLLDSFLAYSAQNESYV